MRRRRNQRIAILGSFLWLLARGAVGGSDLPTGFSPDLALDDLAFVHWTTDDGLPTNTLNYVLQTRDGFLWIASFNGLVRFDGLSFTTFSRSSEPRIPSATNTFHKLVEADDGTLWIGSQGGGLLRFRGGEFELFHQEYGRFSTIRSLWFGEGAATDIWVGVTDFGVYHHVGDELKHLDFPEVNTTVRDIFKDRDGNLWFAAEGKGLIRYRDGEIRRWTTESGLASNAVTAIHQGLDGTLWIGSWGGLSRFEGDRLVSIPELDGIEIYNMYGDAYGNLWLASEQGLFRRNAADGRFESLQNLRGVPIGGVADLAFDRAGSLWLVTTSNGLFQLKPSKFRTWTQESGLSTRRINFIRQMGPDEFWAGADDGAINILKNIAKGGEISTLELRSIRSDQRVRDVLRDRHGEVWVTSYLGLLHLKDGVETLYTTEHGLPTDQLRQLYEDRRGVLWIATRNSGLIKMPEKGRFETIDKNEDLRRGLVSSFVFSIDEDRQGRLVLGTRGALTLLDEAGRFTHYTADDGLPGSIVFSTYTAEDDSLWLSTNGGLARWKDGKIRVLTAAEGLGAETIFDYSEDAFGDAWITSLYGVGQIAKEQLEEFMDGRRPRVDTTMLNEADGMVNRECTGATRMLRASDGSLWIPTLDGIAKLDHRNFVPNRIPPAVVIDGLRVDDRRVALSTSPLIVPAAGKRLVFEMAALSFLAPRKVEVHYKLEGFDTDWIRAGLERKAQYTNLPPGEYTFHVIAANEDGVWNETGAILAFTKSPSFHQRRDVQAAAFGAAILLLWLAYGWRTRAMRRRTRKLEEIVEALERSQEERRRLIYELETSAAEMERFVYTASHDLKNPVVTIHNYLDLLEKDLAAQRGERVEKDLAHLRRASDQVARLLDELLELSQISRGETSFEIFSFQRLAREVVEGMAEPLSAKKIELVMDDLPQVAGDRLRIREMFEALLSNAVAFIGEADSPRIEIGWRKDEDSPGMARFFVRDNGIGIEKRYHEKIFGLFQQLDPGHPGTGVGLAIAKRVAEVHNGKVWVESAGLGHGSTFHFTLPMAPAPEKP